MAICSSNIGPQTRNYTSEFLKIKKTAIYIGREGGSRPENYIFRSKLQQHKNQQQIFEF